MVFTSPGEQNLFCLTSHLSGRASREKSFQIPEDLEALEVASLTLFPDYSTHLLCSFVLIFLKVPNIEYHLLTEVDLPLATRANQGSKAKS